MKTIPICLLVAVIPWVQAASVGEALPTEDPTQGSEGENKTVDSKDADKFFLPIPNKLPLLHQPVHEFSHHDNHHDHDHYEPNHHHDGHKPDISHKPIHKPELIFNHVHPLLHKPVHESPDHGYDDDEEHDDDDETDPLHDHHKPHFHQKPDHKPFHKPELIFNHFLPFLHKPTHDSSHHDNDNHYSDHHDEHVPDVHKPFHKPEFFFHPFSPFLFDYTKPFSHSGNHIPHKPDNIHDHENPHFAPDHDSHEPDHHGIHGEKPSGLVHGIGDHKPEWIESWFKLWSYIFSPFRQNLHSGHPWQIHHYHHYLNPSSDHVVVDTHPAPGQHPVEEHPSDTYQSGYPQAGFNNEFPYISAFPSQHISGFYPQAFPYFPQKPQFPGNQFLPQPFKESDDKKHPSEDNKNKVPTEDPDDSIKGPSEDGSNTTPRSVENEFTIGYHHHGALSPLPQYMTTPTPVVHHGKPTVGQGHGNRPHKKPKPTYSPISQMFPQIFWPFTSKPSTKASKKEKKKEKPKEAEEEPEDESEESSFSLF